MGFRREGEAEFYYFNDKPSHGVRSRCMPLLHFLYPDFPNTPLGQLPQLCR